MDTLHNDIGLNNDDDIEQALDRSLAQLQGITLIYDPFTLKILAANNAAAALYGYPIDVLKEKHLAELCASGEFEKFQQSNSDTVFEASGSRVWKHLRSNGKAVYVEMQSSSVTLARRSLRTLAVREVTDRRRLEVFAKDLTGMLERVTRGDSVQDVLTALCEAIERRLPGALCSILVSNRDLTLLNHGAAPSLPTSYLEALKEVPIGASCGACGTAAYRGELVVVSDIATDPLWSEHRDIGLSHGLRACWSSPIFGSDRRVLGTFATYYKEVGEPDADSLEVIRMAAHIAGIVIERVRTVDELRASEERYRDLFENANEIIFTVDADGLITSANKAAEGAFGRGMRLVGRPVSEAIEPNLITSVIGDQTAQEASPRPRSTGHLAVRSAKGAELEVSYRILSEDGRLAGVHCVARDVTEKRRLEERLQQAQKMDALAGMLAGAAHELNNPLTSVIGYAELLNMRDNLSLEAREYADIIIQQGQRAKHVVKNLLTFVHPERLRRSELDINLLIEALKERVEERLASQNIKVILDLHPLPVISADKEQLSQVLTNLVTNAEQALSDYNDGRITISTYSSGTEGGDRVLISVADTGPGIPSGQLYRVFDPFFTTRQVGEGTGLGLAVCYGIVKAHGGEISVDSKPGQGAKFVISIPVGPGLPQASGS